MLFRSHVISIVSGGGAPVPTHFGPSTSISTTRLESAHKSHHVQHYPADRNQDCLDDSGRCDDHGPPGQLERRGMERRRRLAHPASTILDPALLIASSIQRWRQHGRGGRWGWGRRGDRFGCRREFGTGTSREALADSPTLIVGCSGGSLPAEEDEAQLCQEDPGAVRDEVGVSFPHFGSAAARAGRADAGALAGTLRPTSPATTGSERNSRPLPSRRCPRLGRLPS